MSNYPTLRLGVLQGLASLKELVDADRDYLRRADCPYDRDTVEMLEKLFEPRTVEVIKEVPIGRSEAAPRGRPKKHGELTDADAVEVENEALQLLNDLRGLSKTTDGEMKNLDTATKLQIIKAQASLMEKLVSIRERFSGVRKVAAFQQTVIAILDELVDEDKRDVFLQRLEPFRSN